MKTIGVILLTIALCSLAVYGWLTSWGAPWSDTRLTADHPGCAVCAQIKGTAKAAPTRHCSCCSDCQCAPVACPSDRPCSCDCLACFCDSLACKCGARPVPVQPVKPACNCEGGCLCAIDAYCPCGCGGKCQCGSHQPSVCASEKAKKQAAGKPSATTSKHRDKVSLPEQNNCRPGGARLGPDGKPLR